MLPVVAVVMMARAVLGELAVVGKMAVAGELPSAQAWNHRSWIPILAVPLLIG